MATRKTPTRTPKSSETGEAAPRPPRKKAAAPKAADVKARTARARKSAAAPESPAATTEAPPVLASSAGTESLPAAPPAPARAASRTPSSRRPSHDQIARRAAEIWSQRGGNALENWLQAERELSR